MKALRYVILCICLLGFCTRLDAYDPKETKALSHYIMGVYYEDLGDADKALDEYRQALKSESASSIHIGLASAYVRKGDLAQAIGELKKAVALEPDSIEPHAVLAIIYASLNKTALAESEYEAALKLSLKQGKEDPAVRKSLGALYLKQDKPKDAETSFKSALAIAPNDPQAHFYLGLAYEKQKETALSEKEIKEAIRLNPEFAVALNYLGYTYALQNRNLNEAERLVNRALKLDPHNGAYIDSLGWVYFKKGRYRQALEQLEKAGILLEDAEVYDHLGDVYLKLGNKEKAKENYRKSLELVPDQVLVKGKFNKIK